MPTPKDAPYKLAQQVKPPRRFVPIPRALQPTDAEQVRANVVRDALVEWAASKRPSKDASFWPEMGPLTRGERLAVREYLAEQDAKGQP